MPIEEDQSKMSSLSGDENEVTENEPVRRTRSGRALKAPVPTPKKTPVKKTPARTRATRLGAVEAETVDEAIPCIIEEVDEGSENSAGENGMQQYNQEEMETYEAEDLPVTSLGLELEEDSSEVDDIEDLQYQEMERESQEVPELEAPPPPVVCNNPPSTTILSTLRVKESSQMMVDSNVEVINLDENITEEILETQDDNENESTLPMEVEETVPEIDDEYCEAPPPPIESDDPPSSPILSTLRVKESSQMMMDGEETAQEIDEYSEDKQSEGESEETKKAEPDTEAVSEDEFPTEAAAKSIEDMEDISDDDFTISEISFKEPETEAVSDEELPSAAPADLGETESVSEDELPPDSEKKRRNLAKAAAQASEELAKVEATGTNKRKLNAEGEYDPSSPTSETNEETPAKKVAVTADTENGEKPEARPASPKKKTLPELEKYWKAVNEDPSDFTGWTYLLQYVDQENDADAAREAYNKFLERYPYCYGYWRKYADYEKKKGNPDNVQTVFDQGLKAISLSVDLWLHYINHCKTIHDKDEDKLREQYERAIEACGLEFRSDRLWESYIKWELEGKRLSRVTAIYDRLLTTPTFGYMSHFQTFQEFVSTNSPNKILSVDDFLAIRAEVKALLKAEEIPATTPEDEAPPGEEPSANEAPPTDEETRAIREKIISSRRKMHKANVNAVAARWTYEEGIKRPYFHVKPLERCQLKNWKEYLDYEIEQKDQTRIIILFERCLIACALYDEFWLRFVRYLESLKGDNTEKIRDVYSRACNVDHPKKTNLYLQWATFEEGQGMFDKAAEILETIDSVMPNMLQVAYRRINLERRRGDLEKSCTLYESYITNSKNRTIANNIAVKYARFLCKFKNDIDRAVKVLLKATDKDKDNPRLYLQLIDLGLQRNPVDTEEVIGYMDMFIDRENADPEQRVLFAQRKVEFLEDFSPDIKLVLKAHEQFQKCIKQAKERKKSKTEESKVELSPSSKKSRASDAASVPPPPTASSASGYQYSSGTSTPYQSQQQFPSGQYGGQSGYQQGYQQYPPPSDPNYANYQNWQYSQGGPQAYGAYNQWGSYNYY